MFTRGICNREGEVIGYIKNECTYDLNGVQTGKVEGRTVFDLDGNRHWLLDGDAILDTRGNVIGYLGEPYAHDEDEYL